MSLHLRRIQSRTRRLISFSRSAIEANLQDLSIPYRLFVHLTNACSCRCWTCGIWKKPVCDELSTNEVLGVLEDAGRYVKWMDFTGGEIFLRDDIERLLDFVASGMPRLAMFHFATNGLDTRRVVAGARRIASSDIPRFIVTVSLDGPEALHDRIRGVPGGWARSLETFRRLREVDVEVVFGMTLSEHNADGYDDTFEAVAMRIPEIRHHDFHVNLAQVSEVYYGNQGQVRPPGPRLLKALETIRARRGWGIGPVTYLERSFLEHARHYVRTGITPMLCEAFSSSAVLGPQGDLFPCIVFDRPIGNVREWNYSIERLFRSRRCQLVRDEIRKGRCPHCWTPCEAYQAIIANTLPLGKNRRNPPNLAAERQTAEAGEGVAGRS